MPDNMTAQDDIPDDICPPKEFEPLELSIVRLADAIGLLHPDRRHRVEEIGGVKMQIPGWPLPMNFHVLSEFVKLPAANELIQAKCNHCEAIVETRRMIAPFVACEPCIERIVTGEKMEANRSVWEKICPATFRATDEKHPDFPVAIYQDLKKKAGSKQSLFLFGPTGSSKTRVGMLMLKRALLRDQRVGVLWPEKLHLLTKGYDNALFDKYAEYDALLMDDTLLTACRESKLLDTVKLLLDVRMRNERVTIFTSQIGTEDEIAGGKEFGEAKPADIERIKAIIRRLRESCVIVSFAQVDPQKSF